MKVTQFPKEISEELAEEAGWHIGDGSMNYYKNRGQQKGIYQLRGHIEDDKNHYITRIKPIFKNLYGIDLSLREMPSTRVFGFQIWSDELVNFKQKLGLPLGFKLNIEIPPVFVSNDQLKAAVIRGIFDTDGCLYFEKKASGPYPRMEIKTISFKLSQQLFELLNSLGFRATTYKERFKKDGNQRDSYAVIMRGKYNLNKFFQEVKPANQKHINKYVWFTQSFK